MQSNSKHVSATVKTHLIRLRLLIVIICGCSTDHSFALDLSSISPLAGPIGSEVHLYGAGFGASDTGKFLALRTEMNGPNYYLEIRRWTDTEIVTIIPPTAKAGVNYIYIAYGPAYRTHSRMLEFQLTVQLNPDYRPRGPIPPESSTPTLQFKPGILPSQRARAGGDAAPDIMLRPDVARQLTHSAKTPGECVDLMLAVLTVHTPVHHLDGTYDFTMRATVRNNGRQRYVGRSDEAILLFRENRRELQSRPLVSNHASKLVLEPGAGVSDSVLVKHWDPTGAGNVSAMLSYPASVSTDSSQENDDCNISNNLKILNAAELRRLLLIRNK